MIIQANLSEAQTGVGYRFYDAVGWLGSRITSGITSPRTGIYVAAAASPPVGAVGVYWDCDDVNVNADVFLVDRIMLEFIFGKFAVGDPTEPVTIIGAPDAPNQTVGYITTRDAQGVQQAGVKLYFTLRSAPTPDSYRTKEFSAISDVNGMAQIALRKSASYTAKRGKTGTAVTFTAHASADSFALPQVLGIP